MALYPFQSIKIFTYCSFRYPIRPSSFIYCHLSALNHINNHFSVFLLIRSEIVCLCMHHVCNKHYKACEAADDQDKPCGNLNEVTLYLDSHWAWGNVNQGRTNFPKI
jgi:hypothetical protein